MSPLPRKPRSRQDQPPVPEAAILDAIRSLRYGSVEITVHDSRVVQMECRNKVRFPEGDPAES
jgi:hypothetical protein